MKQEQIDAYFEDKRPEIIVGVRSYMHDAGARGIRFYYHEGQPASDAHLSIRTASLCQGVLLKWPDLAPQIPDKDDVNYDAPKALGLWLQQQVDEMQKPFCLWGVKVGGVDPMKNADWSKFEWLLPVAPDDARHRFGPKKKK